MIALVLGLLGAGDAFLRFVGSKIHVNIAYENHSGFLSCFILKHIILGNPVFTLEEPGLAIGCKKAFIEPDFSELISKKAITLRCTFQDVAFLHIEERISDPENMALFFEGGAGPLLDRIKNMRFDAMRLTLVIYGETAEFPHFEAHSKDIKIYASGRMSESGDFKLKLKAFISPEMAGTLPLELSVLLTEESRGWLSYSLDAEGAEDEPFLRLKSDRIKIDFEKIEIK